MEMVWAAGAIYSRLPEVRASSEICFLRVGVKTPVNYIHRCGCRKKEIASASPHHALRDGVIAANAECSNNLLGVHHHHCWIIGDLSRREHKLYRTPTHPGGAHLPIPSPFPIPRVEVETQGNGNI